MSKKQKLIPEIRFPEFKNEGEWEEVTLGYLSQIVKGEQLNRIELTETGKYPCQNGGINPSGYTDKFNTNENTITISEGGNSCGYINYMTSKFWLGGHCYKLVVNHRIDKSYLYQALKFNEEDIMRLRVGSGLPNIQQNAIRNFKFVISNFLPEQQKIASCLSSLDDLIKEHSQKLDLLKDHKKGLMQNLFPQEGEKVPKVRFKEFEKDGEWVEKTLGECLKQKPEYGINAPAVPYSDKMPTYLRITDISEDGVFLSNDKVSVDKDVFENNYLSEGDVVLARTGASVGKSYKYREKDGELVFAGFLIRVKPNLKKIDSEFLFQFLSTSQYWKWVSFISARSGQPGINGTEYSSMPISLPLSINEQQKIASCLSSLDDIIATQIEKIDQLKQQKKGLMQGLFPKINE